MGFSINNTIMVILALAVEIENLEGGGLIFFILDPRERLQRKNLGSHCSKVTCVRIRNTYRSDIYVFGIYASLKNNRPLYEARALVVVLCAGIL